MLKMLINVCISVGVLLKMQFIDKETRIWTATENAALGR